MIAQLLNVGGSVDGVISPCSEYSDGEFRFQHLSDIAYLIKYVKSITKNTIITTMPEKVTRSNTMSSSNSLIRLHELSKAYSEGDKFRQVLKSASASFPQGEFTAIIGKSGTGKSTLLNLISGIDDVDEGEIWFGDQELTGMDDTARTTLPS